MRRLAGHSHVASAGRRQPEAYISADISLRTSGQEKENDQPGAQSTPLQLCSRTRSPGLRGRAVGDTSLTSTPASQPQRTTAKADPPSARAGARGDSLLRLHSPPPAAVALPFPPSSSSRVGVGGVLLRVPET